MTKTGKKSWLVRQDAKNVAFDGIDFGSSAEVSLALSKYCIKSHLLAMRISGLGMSCSNLDMPYMDSNSDSFFDRMAGKIGNIATQIGRNSKIKDLSHLKDDCICFVQDYRHLFEAGNSILSGHGLAIHFAFNFEIDLTIDNTLNNRDWLFDFGHCCEQVRMFITETATLAEKMCFLLDALTETEDRADY